jgi:hypothetical protein
MINNFDNDEVQPSSLYIMSTEKFDKKYNYKKVLNNKINLINDKNNYRIINNNIMENSNKLFNKDMMKNNLNLYNSTNFNSIDNSKILKINKKPIINQLLINDNYFKRKINNKKLNKIKYSTINTSSELNNLKIKNTLKNNYKQSNYFTIQSQKDIKNKNLKKYIGTISNNLINKTQNFNENLYINRISNFNIHPLE